VPSRLAPLRSRVTAVWAILVLAAALSYLLAETDHAGTGEVVIVILLAFAKVRLVGLYFMELRTAPLLLRVLFDAYCALVCLAILAMFVFD
jgi:caa(3)-type oxidase subunit IV